VERQQECLYCVLYVARERIEDVLERLVDPIVAQVRQHPDLDSLFFVRYSEPRWQLRLRLLGRPEWIGGPLRKDVERRIVESEKAGDIEGHEFHRYEREYERYGGEIGMSLAEKLFHLDSLACLDLIRIDRAGRLAKSRRELAMALVDRFLDVARFDDAERLELYRYGYAWALELKTWGADDLEILEQRFQSLRPGLERFFFGPGAEDPVGFYGGAEAASVATRFLDEARPVVDEILKEHRDGGIRQTRLHLFWSYTHMLTNRLGVEASPEAILRYFMCRLLEERARNAASSAP